MRGQLEVFHNSSIWDVASVECERRQRRRITAGDAGWFVDDNRRPGPRCIGLGRGWASQPFCNTAVAAAATAHHARRHPPSWCARPMVDDTRITLDAPCCPTRQKGKRTHSTTRTSSGEANAPQQNPKPYPRESIGLRKEKEDERATESRRAPGCAGKRVKK